MYRLDVRNGNREVSISQKRRKGSARPIHVAVTRLSDNLYRIEANDPLENSLSVTVPRWLDRFTLQFGLHVEHHLFPSVSGRHAPRIRELLRAHWPGRYRELPLP